MYLPVSKRDQQEIANSLESYIDENFSDDKTSMLYWVLMRMMADLGLSFHYWESDRSEERERIG